MHLLNFLPASFFRWCQHTWIARYQADSLWAFAIIETVHILGLTVLLGTLLAMDLRLLGLSMRRYPTEQVAKELHAYFETHTDEQVAKELTPLTLGALGLMVLTGIPMFMYQAIRYSTSMPFFIKMMFLLTAVSLHFTIHRKAILQDVNESSRLGKVSACLSLVCWLGVAFAGRAIAFVQ